MTFFSKLTLLCAAIMAALIMMVPASAQRQSTPETPRAVAGDPVPVLDDLVIARLEKRAIEPVRPAEIEKFQRSVSATDRITVVDDHPGIIAWCTPKACHCIGAKSSCLHWRAQHDRMVSRPSTGDGDVEVQSLNILEVKNAEFLPELTSAEVPRLHSSLNEDPNVIRFCWDNKLGEGCLCIGSAAKCAGYGNTRFKP